MASLTYVRIMRYIVFIGGSLSFCSCLYMILTYLLCKKLQKEPLYKNVMYLILIDIQVPIWATLMLFTPIRDNYYPCELLGFYEYFLRLSSIFWTKVFADSIYRTIIKRDQIDASATHLIFSSVFIPLTLALIPLLVGGYGGSDLSCGFSTGLQGIEAFLLPMCCFYLPFWVIFIYNLIVFWKIALYVRNRFRDMKTFYMLLLYPLTLLPVNLLAFLYRMEVILFKQVSPVMELFFLILVLSQGFFNTLIYGMDSKVRAEVRNVLRSMFQRNTENWEEKRVQLSIESQDSNPALNR